MNQGISISESCAEYPDLARFEGGVHPDLVSDFSR